MGYAAQTAWIFGYFEFTKRENDRNCWSLFLFFLVGTYSLAFLNKFSMILFDDDPLFFDGPKIC